MSAPTGPAPRPATDPDRVLEVLLRHPEVHPYGIADVAQLWDASTWWVDGDAVLAVLDLPGAATPVVYAVSADAAGATLHLARRLQRLLPDRFECTAPVGFAAAMAPGHRPDWHATFRKMHLARPAALPPPHPDVVTVTRDDLPALRALFATDTQAGDFFHAGLLDTGLYVGLRAGDGRIVAVAGIHVVDESHGVAAIGNVVTHPAHRRRGHARAVVATLCHRLRSRVDVIGLNVRDDNVAAGALYTAMGFDPLVAFEEGVFVRSRGG